MQERRAGTPQSWKPPGAAAPPKHSLCPVRTHLAVQQQFTRAWEDSVPFTEQALGSTCFHCSPQICTKTGSEGTQLTPTPVLHSCSCPGSQKGREGGCSFSPSSQRAAQGELSCAPVPLPARVSVPSPSPGAGVLYLSVLGGTAGRALPSGTVSSTLLLELLLSSCPACCLGTNSGCSCILPLCISEVLLGGLGGGGVCSGGGSRSSLESSFHCSCTEGQALFSFSLLHNCSNFKLYHGRIFILYLKVALHLH